MREYWTLCLPHNDPAIQVLDKLPKVCFVWVETTSCLDMLLNQNLSIQLSFGRWRNRKTDSVCDYVLLFYCYSTQQSTIVLLIWPLGAVTLGKQNPTLSYFQILCCPEAHRTGSYILPNRSNWCKNRWDFQRLMQLGAHPNGPYNWPITMLLWSEIRAISFCFFFLSLFFLHAVLHKQKILHLQCFSKKNKNH